MSVRSERLPQSNGMYVGALIALAVLVALLVFRDSLLELFRRWNTQEEYSHGYFIPLISAWLLWSRRHALVASIGQPSWAGLLLILLAAGMHVVGELSSVYILSQVAFIIVLLGMTLGLGGVSLLRVAFIPIIFLTFAIPLPYFVDSILSWRLQIISSQLGVMFIRLFQVPVFLEGNVIDLGQYKLQVVDACSGLRYLYPLLGLGFLAAYLFHAPFWKRAIVFLSTIPITILMNSVRIGMVGIIVDRFGPQSGDGLLHMFEGWIIFIACAALLALEIYVLSRFGSRKSFFEVFYPPNVEPVPPSGGSASPTNMRVPLLACIALLFAGGATGYYVSGRQEIIPDRVRFAAFPNTIADWNGRPQMMQPQVEHGLGLTDYILSDYSRTDRRPVNLYIAYYASQRKGVSPHSPSVCIPGNGWQITQFDRTSYSSEDARISLPFNRAIIQKGTQKQIVYYWFEQRGRRIENEWWSKWLLLTDAIAKNRTDGALVRLTTPVLKDESERDADKRLQEFVKTLIPSLSAFLPAESLEKAKPAQAGLPANRS